MSGGQLVVMDRSGRDVKRYSLPEGLVTLGSDPDCDIRVMLPAIKQHHATVVVHANQTIVRNVSDGETLVNGHVVSVAALRHGDVITLGDRSLRWEYYEPTVPRPLAPEPALHVKRKVKNRGRKRGSEVAPRRIEPAVRLALEMKHRASMPGATKQVAIVQPQRRDESAHAMETKIRLMTKPHRPYIQSRKVPRSTKLLTSSESRISRKRMNQSDQSTSHTNETEVRYSSIETDVLSESKSNTRGRKMKSLKNDNVRNRTVAEETPTQNVTHESDRMHRKSKITLNSDSPKNKNPKSRNPKSIMNISSNALLENSTETKASQWIASRKTSPRKTHTPKTNETKSAKYVHVATPRPKEPYIETSPSKMLASSSPIKVVQKRSTPLRTVVLKKMVTPNDHNKSLVLSAKKSQSVSKTRVQKIEEPLHLDDNKKVALMLLTRTTKSDINAKSKTPVLVVKKPSPVKSTPKRTELERKSKRTSKEIRSPNSSAAEISDLSVGSNKRDSIVKTFSTRDSVSKLSSNFQSEMVDEGSPLPLRNQIVSPSLPSPKKSAMRDPSVKRNQKKIESIKFDLSNIETTHDEVEPKEPSTVYERSDVLTETEEDLTLRYSESPPPTPSPRRSIHSRSNKIMEKTLGETFSINSSEYDGSAKSITPSLSPRKSLRSSLMVEKALNNSLEGTTDLPKKSRNKSQRLTMPVDTSSKVNVSEKSRSLNNMETYSIVDLVSLNANETGSVIDLGSVEENESEISSSIYDSAASDRGSVSTYHSSAINNSQRSSPRRKTYSLSPSHIGTSTPYVGKMTPRKSLLTKSHKSISETLNSPINNNISLRKSKSLPIQSYESDHDKTYDNVSNISVEITRPGDTFTITFSPQSTSRKTRSNTTVDVSKFSQSKTLISSLSKKDKVKQSRNGSSFMVQAMNGEPSTPPENVITTSEPSTPILNIQHLLDSSNLTAESDIDKVQKQKRVRKRQTIGPSIYKKRKISVTRSVWTDPKKGTKLSKVSKTNLNSAKKSLLKGVSNDTPGVSNITDENVPKDDSQENVTPKSIVKLVQPGVKEIHSTAKKPISKRSIIDDLSESVIVKQLFNSPVKRKLSQSMTEFSKTEFTEDSTIKGKRKRAASGLTSRSPNQSLDLGNVNTPQVPTEIFVSPMTTPQQSPKLDGLKRLFVKNTPNNDLTNVSGVKRLLRTPRKHKSPHNDLTNVLGVKETFTKKSPGNDLTDVTGVKRLYGVKKNRTRLSGARSLFPFDKSKKSPKNDFSDVQGVKRLFTVEESKLQRKNTKKDVSFTRGEKGTSKYDSDFTGVEELFEGPSRMQFSRNSTFDKLLGKPQIKATYSKSFCTKSKTPSKLSKAAQSFHEPIDFTSMNVEKWLEQELVRKIHKEAPVVPGTPGGVIKNASVNRELQKLTTDTVEGKTPILKSRVRNSTVNKSISCKSEQKRLSNLDRNSLPIKKRSLASDLGTPKEKAVHRKSNLPIKKRAIIHSTPVANRRTLASNVSELERVSPIVGDNPEYNPEAFHTTTSINTSIKAKLIESEEKSPKKQNLPKRIKGARSDKERSRARVPKQEIAKSPKATRIRRGVKVADAPITKNVRKSLVITKKLPIMSPQVKSTEKIPPRILRRGRKTNAEISIQLPDKSLAGKESSVKTTRTTRGRGMKNSKVEHVIAKDVTVQNQRETKTRARNKQTSLTPAIVVTKPSPKMKPQSKKKTVNKQANQKSPIQKNKELRKRTRAIANEVEKMEKPIQNMQRRTRKTENIEMNILSPKITRRGRNIMTAEKLPRKLRESMPKQKTKTILRDNIKQANDNNVQNLKERKRSKATKRNANNTAVSEEEVVPRKTRKTGLVVDVVPKIEMTRKTNKTVETALEIKKKTKSRARKIEESPKKTARGNKKKDESSVVPEKLPRGRKRNIEIAEPAAPFRGRKPTKQESTKKPREAEEKLKMGSPAKTRITRSQKKVVQVEGAGSKRRGRK